MSSGEETPTCPSIDPDNPTSMELDTAGIHDGMELVIDDAGVVNRTFAPFVQKKRKAK
jgi:hypothetical protein